MLTFIIFVFGALVCIGIACAVISLAVTGLTAIMTAGFYLTCALGFVLLGLEKCLEGCKWIGRKIALRYNKLLKKQKTEAIEVVDSSVAPVAPVIAEVAPVAKKEETVITPRRYRNEETSRRSSFES